MTGTESMARGDRAGRDDVLLHKILLACGDMFSVVLAFYLSFMIRNYFFAWRGGVYGATYKHTFFLAGLLLAVFLHFRNSSLYRQLGFGRSVAHLETVTRAWVNFVVLFIALSFFFKVQLFIEHRITVALFIVSGWSFLYVHRFVLAPLLAGRLLRSTHPQTRVAVVGAGPEGQHLARRLARRSRDVQLVGFVDDAPPGADATFPLLGPTSRLADIIRAQDVQEVYLEMAGGDSAKLMSLLADLKPLGIRVRVALRHFGILNQKVDYLPDVEDGILFINSSPLEFFDRMLKRTIDLAVATLGLVATSPLFLVLAILIKLESPGPVFFRQRRTGKDGKVFRVFKFRSMRSNTEAHHKAAVGALMGNRLDFFGAGQDEGILKAVDQSQVTRLGGFLRGYSLDELPQLINVALGHMSLVGPRPEPEYQVALYKPWQHERHAVKPGITGFWQVYGRSTVSHDDMVLMDIFYISNWSISLDLRILARTFLVVLTGKGAL